MVVATFAMAAGARFDWHTHPDHQLAWASSGVLTVVTDLATWVLPPTRALWIPAELPHETLASGRATMRTLYIRPDLFPITWSQPTPVAARQLLGELIGYLENEPLDPARRGRAESLLVDLLEPVALATIEVKLPVEPRARRGRSGSGGQSRRQADPRGVGTPRGSKRADLGPSIPGRHRHPVRALADFAAAPGGSSRPCRRRARGKRVAPGRLRQHQRLRRRLPSRDRTDPVDLRSRHA